MQHNAQGRANLDSGKSETTAGSNKSHTKTHTTSCKGSHSNSGRLVAGCADEDLSRLVECMALNSNTSSDQGSDLSEIDSFLIEGVSGTGSECEGGEPEYLLPRTPPLSPREQVPATRHQDTIDPETQARLEALLEAAGISKLAENKQLADPEVLERLTSSVSSALDEAAAALTRMRTDPSSAQTQQQGASTAGGAEGTNLVAACTQGDISRVRRLLDEGRVSVHETTEEGESLLSLACSAGYYELAQVLLAMRANVEDRGMKGDCTPLMEAASAGHTDIVRLLIAHGADVNAQSSSGNTPLMYACAGGHEEVVRVLLEAGANVEDHNENGHTPLMEAASAGHCAVAKILLEFGAGINTHSNEFKESALTLACYKGHLEMVRFLLEAGADQEHKTDEMHTALMEASMDGHVEVARLLLDSGAQVNMPADSFESPLTLAACGGHVELAMLLLERGANIEEVNDEGYTPLMEASREGHEEMVALLLSQGADINAQTEETQETALTLACCGGFLEVADFLIKAGADIELGASTPLMEASQEGHLELVKYLLEAKADVNATTGTRDTALTYACENGHTDVADLLLQYGAQLEHESEGGRTPLMKAARAGHLCTVQFLISRGADVSRQTSNNDHTPLSLACAGGHLNVVEVLLQQGADPFHKLKDNSTMLIEAAKGGHTTVVQMLIDYPNSLVSAAAAAGTCDVTAIDQVAAVAAAAADGLERVPPPGSEATPPPTKVTKLRPSIRAAPATSVAATAVPPTVAPNNIAAAASAAAAAAQTAANLPLPFLQPVGNTAGMLAAAGKQPVAAAAAALVDGHEYDLLPGSAGGYLLEDLERKGLDAKSYIQTMLRRTEGSTKEEQIYQKEQILAELQRVEKELQEKAQAQLILNNAETKGGGGKREAAEGKEEISEGMGGNPDDNVQPPVPFSFKLETQPQPTTPSAVNSSTTAVATSSEVLQNMSNQLALSGRSLAALPPSERPKAKPSRKIDGSKGGNKLQLQAALKQHSQQLAQLQQLQQLNQQLQQQVIQQRQLKQQNQQTLAALQQNAIQNQQQLATLQQNVAQLQQLEQTILAQQTPQAHHQQLQHRVHQIMQQKQQLQHQIKQFQQQVEQQLAFTQHAGPVPPPPLSAAPPPLPSGPPPPPPIGKKRGGGRESVGGGGGREGGDGGEASSAVVSSWNNAGGSATTVMTASSSGDISSNTTSMTQGTELELVPTSDLNYIINTEQLINSGGVAAAGIDPSLLTSASFELVQATQALQAVQAVPQILHAESPPIMTPLTQDPSLLDPSQLAQAVKHCPIPLDPSLQVATSGGVNVQYSSALTALPVLSSTSLSNQECVGQHGQPLSGFGHELFLPPNLGGAFNCQTAGAAGGVSVLEAGQVQVAPFQHQPLDHLPPDVNIGLPQVDLPPGDKLKKVNKKKGVIPNPTPMMEPSNYANSATAGLLPPGPGISEYPSTYPTHSAGVPVVDLDSETDSNHDTALTLACAGGHEELVSLLLSRGADNEHKDKKGFTPLILAATAGHDKVVEILLNHGADIEAQSDRTKDTPLSLACSGGRYEVVEILLSRGANKEHRNVSDYTPLSLAASGGYTNIIKLLLAHGAEINSRTGSKLGISPLMLAAMNGHTQAVKLLLDMGSDINAQIETNRNTALTLACFQGRHEVVSLLLDRKANVEHRAKTGLTPLMEAASGGYTEVGRVLLDKGADVNAAPVPSSRDTALTIAADKGHYRFVELLLSRGAQVDVRNKKGNSSLWLAANGGHLDVVQLLYSAGADIDSQDNRKVSCLMAAFRKGHHKVVKWLVKHVTQFPSDTELTRFIATINDKDLLKKTHQCLDIIRVAKDRQASEANKAANLLLEELEQEKTREESKKAAAIRKREKKKRKKAEKKGGKDEEDGEGTDGPVKEINGDNTEDEKEKSAGPTILEAAVANIEDEINNLDLNRDSGIDANSQGSGTSNEKDDKTNSKKKKKTKKNKEKEKNEKNLEKNIENKIVVDNTKKIVEEKENSAPKAFVRDTESKEKSPEEDERPDSRGAGGGDNGSDRSSQPRVPCIEAMDEKINKNNEGFIEPSRKGRNRANRMSGEMDNNNKHVISTATKKAATNAAGAANKAASTDAGWKEVVRKYKKVSVPSNAISRVIGRGGSNINAIRELSGAHIEVEKQSKGQGDRTILIKGSADATRLANTWISAIIANPDKDLQEIVGKQQYKQLSSSVLAKAAAGGSSVLAKTAAVSVVKTVVKTTITTTLAARGGAKVAAEIKKTTVTATISTATKVTTAFTSPVVSSKTKTVTSTSFAAIAAGNDGMAGAAVMQTGPPPSSATKLPTLAAAVAAQQSKQLLQQQQQAAVKPPAPMAASSSNSVSNVAVITQAAAIKKAEDKISSSAAAVPASVAASNDSKDFSPFQTFNFQPQTFGWSGEKQPLGAANKGFSAAPGSSVQVSASADISKAPGYRPPSSHGSPNMTAEAANNWANNGQNQTFRNNIVANNAIGATSIAEAGAPAPVAAPVSAPAGQLYPTQERCNSAPGTPVSPAQVPSPIAPPPANIQPHQQQSLSGGGSPSSEGGWFRPAAGATVPPPPVPPTGVIGSNLRSLTPDGDIDRRWALNEEDLSAASAAAARRQGSGSYGHNSPAKAPGAPIQDPFSTSRGGGLDNLMNAATQLSNLQNYDNQSINQSMTSINQSMASINQSMTASINQSMTAGGIALPDLAPSFSRPSMMPPIMSRFTAPPLTPTTAPTFSQGIPLPDGPKGIPLNPNAPGLNPNAPDFNQGASLYNPRPAMMNPRPIMNGPQKLGTGFPGYGGHFGGGINNFQSILQNQGINAFMSQFGGMPQQQQHSNHNNLDLVQSNFDQFSGKTLSELTDILGPESPYPLSEMIGEPHSKFRAGAIGSERRAAPSPIGMPPGTGNLNRKVDPYTVWDLPPSYNAADNATTAVVSDSFTRLIPSLSGQTISSLDNLVAAKTGFEAGTMPGMGNFNTAAAAGPVMVDVGGGGPHLPMGGHTSVAAAAVAGYGMSANLTPSKVDYTDWGAGGGAAPVPGGAPSSGNKNLMPGAPGAPYIDRAEATSVRRNIVTNQNAMWPKNWAEE